jgi:hypothetical protein
MNSMAQVANDEDWRSAVRAYRKNPNSWDRRILGARPGHDGCRCPAHILAEVGFPLVIAFQPKEMVANGRATGSRRTSPANQGAWHERSLSAASLRTLKFPPVNYIVPGYIAEGLTILAGRPKLGKSWLVLDLCLAVAGGRETLGDVRPIQGDALYLALEDNPRRLQRRVDKLLGAFAETWPSRLIFSTDWRRMNEGGIDDLHQWCDNVQKPRLIVIDTLAKVRPATTGKSGPTYDDDYRSIGELHRLANDRGIAIVLIHHVRKMDAEDPIDTVSGTLGLTGAADTVLVLDRRSDTGMTLYGRGRDIEEIETAIEFDRHTCRWTIRGQASDIRRSDERGKITNALDEAGEPLSPSDVALITGMPNPNVRQLLFKMAKAGEVEKAGRGKYVASNGTGVKADNIDNNITEGEYAT